MTMFTMLITTTVLAVLYGLAWHNQPARQREQARDNSGSSDKQG